MERLSRKSSYVGGPQIIQVMDDHDLVLKHIETHGDLGIPHFKKPHITSYNIFSSFSLPDSDANHRLTA